MLEIFALIVLGVVLAAGIWLVVTIGNIPGTIARAAQHPQADAISVLAWIGLLTMGLGWFIALVWARMKPAPPAAALDERFAELEARLARMEADS
jgi:cytochrome c biogenesis protein CcdA